MKFADDKKYGTRKLLESKKPLPNKYPGQVVNEKLEAGWVWKNKSVQFITTLSADSIPLLR